MSLGGLTVGVAAANQDRDQAEVDNVAVTKREYSSTAWVVDDNDDDDPGDDPTQNTGNTKESANTKNSADTRDSGAR